MSEGEESSMISVMVMAMLFRPGLLFSRIIWEATMDATARKTALK
jgi:hypothetical protein